MASESQFSSQTTTLGTTAVNTIDKFLTDSIPNSTVTTTAGNNSSIVVSSGSKGDVNIAITPPSSSITGSLSEAPGKTLDFQLPANTGIVSKNIDANTVAAAESYVKSIVDKYIPDAGASPAALVQKQTVIAALTVAMTLAQGNSSISVSIRNIDFFKSGATSGLLDSQHQAFSVLDSSGTYHGADSLVGATDVLLDAGSSTGSQLFVLNLLNISDKTLVLKNVEAAVLASKGTVITQGSTPIRITSDNSAQNVTGGDGNDTLVGTGNDTLTGGAGSDVFGISGAGKYTITDFNKAVDMLAVDIAGVTNITQLAAKVTSIDKTSSSVTYHLGTDTTVTLIGVTAPDLTASMIKFTLS